MLSGDYGQVLSACTSAHVDVIDCGKGFHFSIGKAWSVVTLYSRASRADDSKADR